MYDEHERDEGLKIKNLSVCTLFNETIYLVVPKWEIHPERYDIFK